MSELLTAVCNFIPFEYRNEIGVISSVCPCCKSDKVHISLHYKKSLCAECDYQWEWATESKADCNQ